MKQFIPEEHRSRTMSNICVVAAGMLMLALLLYFKDMCGVVGSVLGACKPFFVGIALAFIQLPIVRNLDALFMHIFSRRKPHRKLCRVLSSVISMLILVACVAAFILILLPQLVKSTKQIVTMVTMFINNNIDTVSNILVENGFAQINGNELVVIWENILGKASSYISVVLDRAMSISTSIYRFMFDVLIGLITSFYFLVDKERFCAVAKKAAYGTVSKNVADKLVYWSREAGRIFSGFVFGKVVDSLIMGLLCYLGMTVFRMDYPLLISVVVGVTNIIPFFGPFIGAVPSAFILLIISPYEALGFVVFVVVLQQIDGNIIGPLILGDRVGISAFWIMVAIVVGSALFGFVGMILGVPVVALVYAIVKTIVETRLEAREMPKETAAYVTQQTIVKQEPFVSKLFRRKKRS